MAISFDPAAYASGTVIVPANQPVKGAPGTEIPNAPQPVVDTLAGKSGKAVEGTSERPRDESNQGSSQQNREQSEQRVKVDRSVLVPLQATIQENDNSELLDYALRQRAIQAYRENSKLK
jgi:hypothetical protein